MASVAGGFSPGPSTHVRRKERAIGDAGFIAEVIDESLLVHVAFTTLEGLPQCLPMAFARIGEVLYLHGAVANRLLHAVAGTRCSLTFTLLDGLVFARSAFHHSMNYRCVVAIGRARLVDDLDEKREALEAIVDHVAKGRSAECIGMTIAEVRSTCVIAVDVEEAVAKQRKGPPIDDAEHVALGQQFAGVIPLALRADAIERDVPKQSLPIPPSLNHCAHVLGARGLGAQTSYEQHHGEFVFSSDPSRVDGDWVHRVLSTQAYWAMGVEREALETSWQNALVFGVYTATRQIACARVLTDFSRMAYLGDVFVDPEYRGRGCAQALVRFVLEHPVVARCERVLLGTKDAQGLYQRLGFVRAPNSYMVRVKST